MTPYARITGTGSYLPEKILTNRDLESRVETSDEWIVARTGIRERHIAGDGEFTSDLALHAGRRALEAAGPPGPRRPATSALASRPTTRVPARAGASTP